MVRQGVTAVVAIALGLAREPGCGSVDDPGGGPNAPCTRSSDCGQKLLCLDGVCREPDAGPADAAPPASDASAVGDSGDGGG